MILRKWAIDDFSEGIINRVEDDHLPSNVLHDAQNFIARKIGRIKKRSGQRRLNTIPLPGAIQGIYSYYGNDNRKLVAVGGGKACYWDFLSSAFIEIKSDLDISAPVLFETCVNYMVAANGINPPWKWDGMVVSNLANAPVDGQFPTLFKEKLFMVPKSEPSTLLWSGSFAPEDWSDLENYWDITKGDGDKITALRVMLDELVIFKRYSIHVLRGTNKDDFRLDSPETRVGATGPRAVTGYGGYLFFVADDGIYVWNGLRAINISRERIPDHWKNVNQEHLDKAAACVWDGMVWFAVPEGTSSYNNLILVYVPSAGDVTSGKWWVFRGINASCFTEFNTGNEILLYSGDSFDGYVNQQDVGTDDFGNPIEGYLIPATLDEKPETMKYFSFAEIMDAPNANDANLDAAFDYGAFTPLRYESGDELVRIYRFFEQYKGRVLQMKLTHNALGDCELRGLRIWYKPVRLPR